MIGVIEKNYGIVKFFKDLEYLSSNRDQAERDLRKALEDLSKEDSNLSAQARWWLCDFDRITHSIAIEKYWNSLQVMEENERTQMWMAVFSEKEAGINLSTWFFFFP